ncbi:transposase, Ptta/En/Spm [Tanacetum coccineum]
MAKAGDVITEDESVVPELDADAVSAVINRRDVPLHETPLHLAVRLKDPVSVVILMVASADWSLQNEHGWSALQEAVSNREENIAMIIATRYQPFMTTVLFQQISDGFPRDTTVITSSSNVAGFDNQDGNHVDGSRSLGRGHGRSSNVSRGRSGHIGNQDVDYDYDNGSIGRGRGRGRSGNTCGHGSRSTSGSGNPDPDYDNGTHGDTNDNATETSQHVHGSNLLQSIPNHPSQRPMMTLYYGGFAVTPCYSGYYQYFKISFYGSWTTWREVDQESRDIMFEEFQDQYQWHPSENAAVYRAWEKVMSSRFSDILEHSVRAIEDNIKDGNDVSVLKPYTPSWIDQADWEDMIDRVWNTLRWKKKSAIARQNRLSEVDGQISKHTTGSITILQHKFKMEKQKKRHVSLLEAYEYTHTQETTEALENGTDEGSGDGTDEAVGNGTREYITRRSKRVADAVEAAMEDEHKPDASQHPPNDFDLWEKATGGKKKGKLVGLGTRRDTRLMVTTRTSSSSSSLHAHHTGSQPSEQVQTLEEMIRQLQEDNKQMRARSEVEMQVEVQRQVESQLQEHMRQRELETNAREEDRERELPRIVSSANRIRDFYMEISFHFQSSVIPLIGRIAPSDTYRIWKRGSNLGADMTVAGFDGFKIQRSDQTFLFLGDGYEDAPDAPLVDLTIMNTQVAQGPSSTEQEQVCCADGDKGTNCGIVDWYLPMCARSVQIIPGLLRNMNGLQARVAKHQGESLLAVAFENLTAGAE